MREHFLFFLWQYQLYERSDLKTSDGRSLTVVHPGHLNHDAGPDFLNGTVIINGVHWHGHIEIHVLGQDWRIHGHQNDPAYHNVILHVVYDQKTDVIDHNGHPLPTLILKHRIPLHLIKRQDQLLSSKLWIPCSGQLDAIRPITTSMTIQREAINRLSIKASSWLSRLEALQGDWSQLAFEVFLRAMGFKVNGDAFEMLAQHTPYKVIGQNLHDPFRVEAILLGQARLLRKEDEYTARLKREYTFLKKKYGLTPLNPGVCRFLRTRPANFPDRRLMQVVGILCSSTNALGMIMGHLDKDTLEHILKAPASDYWQILSSKNTSSTLGRSSLNSLYINMVAPLHFAIAEKRKDEDYKVSVASFLASIEPESNSVIKRWGKEGITALSALESQGLLHHYRFNCQHKKCLQCPIGMEIMNHSGSVPSAHGGDVVRGRQ